MRNVHMHTPFPSNPSHMVKWIPIKLNDGDVTPFVHDHVRLVVVGDKRFQIHDFQKWFFKQDVGIRRQIWTSLSCDPEDDVVWHLDDSGGEYDGIEPSACGARTGTTSKRALSTAMYSNTKDLYRSSTRGWHEFQSTRCSNTTTSRHKA